MKKNDSKLLIEFVLLVVITISFFVIVVVETVKQNNNGSLDWANITYNFSEFKLYSAHASQVDTGEEKVNYTDDFGNVYYFKDMTGEGHFIGGGTCYSHLHSISFDNMAPGDKVEFNLDIYNYEYSKILYNIEILIDGIKYSSNFDVNAFIDDVPYNKSNLSDFNVWDSSIEGNKKTFKIKLYVPIEIEQSNHFFTSLTININGMIV